MLALRLASLTPIAHALLRIVAGAMFAQHGAQKLFGALGGTVMPVGSQLWIGAVIELVGGALIALGLFTRPSAFVASGTMAVAYFQFHWKLHLGTAVFPAVNKGELAVLYCFVFLVFACTGAGKWGLDGVLIARDRGFRG
ncbi:MAG TPA: DoxX family protein [Haliangiales bacterium]|nr:DoxX family protein [Haliangiales bacterium]